MDDYIELGPDDVIREGDEWSLNRCQETRFWHDALYHIGRKVKDTPGGYFRRPRSVAIRDAALRLLRDVEKNVEEDSPVYLLKDSFDELREALGVTVEELRGK